MAKPNYQFEKRQRDLAKKSKQEEKRRQKLASKGDAGVNDQADGEAASDQVTDENGSGGGASSD